MHLRLALNLLQFLPDLGMLFALRHAPDYYEIHPRTKIQIRPLNPKAFTFANT
jgi:hypothetical protein